MPFNLNFLHTPIINEGKNRSHDPIELARLSIAEASTLGMHKAFSSDPEVIYQAGLPDAVGLGLDRDEQVSNVVHLPTGAIMGQPPIEAATPQVDAAQLSGDSATFVLNATVDTKAQQSYIDNIAA